MQPTRAAGVERTDSRVARVGVTQQDIDLATRLVRDAAGIAANLRRAGNLDTRSKTSVSDVVTAADLAAERYVVQVITTERPDDGLLGEEGDAWDGPSGRRWVIDPVDGTYNFASGWDYWCSAIALTDGDELLLGAVAHLATDTVYVGGPGVPTTRNGEPLPQLPDSPVDTTGAATYLHPGFIGSGEGYDAWLRAASLPATLRMLGSGSMDLVGVAEGRLGCWFQQGTPAWDWLPGSALVAGVGGTCVQVDAGGVTWSVAGPRSTVASLTDALRG